MTDSSPVAPGLEAAWQEVDSWRALKRWSRCCAGTHSRWLVGTIAAGVDALGASAMRLPTWRTAQAEDWLGRWAMNLNVKRRRNASMALRWTAAGMMEVTKGCRRLKAHKQVPILKAALAALQAKHTTKQKLEGNLQAA